MVLFLEGLLFSKVAPTEKYRPCSAFDSDPGGFDFGFAVAVDF